MNIEASYDSYKEMLREFCHNQWVSMYSDRGATRTDWHSPFIEGYNRFFNLSSDLKIHNWNQTFLDNFKIVESGTEPTPVMLIFLLEGYLQATYRDSTYYREISVKAGQSLLMFSGLGKRGTWFCPYGVKSQTVEVVIEGSRLASYLEAEPSHASLQFQRLLCDYSEEPYFHSGVITPEMQMVLHQYLNCPYSGAMQRMYLESKAVELLTLKLAQMVEMQEERPSNGTNRLLNVDDMERVHQAREILVENMADPPSLPHLAAQVGIGDYKLKRDFRKAFGTTVFGYLRSHRLEQARQLLMGRQMSVSEVAEFVGYGSVSKFTAAFKRQFGVLPSSCLGKRSYLLVADGTQNAG
ncbi:MAG: helix-turn-helix domain-containing protein [Geitlerinemataceae cyanobacterium]